MLVNRLISRVSVCTSASPRLAHSTLDTLSTTHDLKNNAPVSWTFGRVFRHESVLNLTGRPRVSLQRNKADRDAASLRDSGRDTSKDGVLRAYHEHLCGEYYGSIATRPPEATPGGDTARIHTV